MNQKDLETFAREAAKHLKTEKDLSDFTQMLTKVAVEAALNGEMDATLAMRSTRSQRPPTAAMAIPARP